MAGSVQAAVGHSQYNKENPARLSAEPEITGRDSTRDIRHIGDQPGRSGITYQPGDALGIWFDNDADRGEKCWP